jgi:hypothetical protein
MKGDSEALVMSELVKWSERFVLRQRIHRVRVVLPPAAGQRSDESPLNIPTENPFLWCALGWASNRPHEGRYTSLVCHTDQVLFITEPTKLGAFGGVDCENGPMAWGPSKLIRTDRFVVQLFRDLTVDPAEVWPGNTIDSQVDFAFIGFDLLPLHPGEDENRTG